MEKPETDKPIFITGSVRTGTSVMTRALTEGAGIPGYTEGCFIDFIGTYIWHTEMGYNNRSGQKRNKEIMLAHVDQETYINDLLTWFKNQYNTYNQFSGRWIDKTASKPTIFAMPYIQKMWPEAQFIVMNRRPIENMESRLRKFPVPSFEEHCTMLANIHDVQQEALHRLPQTSYITIDQYDVATKPQEVAQKVGIFLNLSVDQIRSVEAYFTDKRPEYTGGDESDVRSLDETDWTDAQKEMFKEKLSKMVIEGGWTVGNQYYA